MTMLNGHVNMVRNHFYGWHVEPGLEWTKQIGNGDDGSRSPLNITGTSYWPHFSVFFVANARRVLYNTTHGNYIC